MKINIDISRNINEQFRDLLGGEVIENGFIIHPKYGTKNARCTYVEFPGGLEFYHFGLTEFKVPIEMRTINESDSDWFLVHINLSPMAQEKSINGEQIRFQKHLPIGILFCGQNLEMKTVFPLNMASEVVSIRFNRAFLLNYLSKDHNKIELSKNIAYEDIDEVMEKTMFDAVRHMTDKMKCHALLLSFLTLLFSKLSKHETSENKVKLHAKDLENIMKISVYLRDPINNKVPSISEMAKLASMGITKFKKSFKLVFGKPPQTYRNRIRMEYAQQSLLKRLKTPTELSYELGYSHPSNFSSAYKKYFGKLPSEE